MAKLFMGLLFGAVAGVALGMVLGPTLVGAQNSTDYTPPFDSKEKRESNNKMRGLLDQIKGRVEEALAAGKDAAREREEELQQRYRDSIAQRRR